MTLYYAQGPSIVQEFKALGYKIFVDLKLNDIPHQVRGAAQSIASAGADLLTVHASGGQEMMEAANAGVIAGATGDYNVPYVIAITVLTSFNQTTLNSIGIQNSVEEQVGKLADLAIQSGLDGVVCSPQETASLRHRIRKDAIIVTPGVRPASAANQDQQRVATPQAALKAGATYLVIGRPITQAEDPKQAFDDIVRSIND
jgi:orotidine-5'-phosphate decarboxylase